MCVTRVALVPDPARLGSCYTLCVRAFPLLLLLLAAACGDGGGGDKLDQPVKGAVTGTGRIADLTSPPGGAPPPTSIVRVTARVVAIDAYDETGQGQAGAVYVADVNAEPGPFQAVQLFKPAYSPPSFRPIVDDVVDVSGIFEEFQIPNLSFLDPTWKTPQISGSTLTLRVDAAGKQAPAKLVLEDLFTYATGKKWISQLVTVENVVITAAPKGSGGRLAATIAWPGQGAPPVEMGVKPVEPPSITNEFCDIGKLGLGANQTVKRVTGIVTMFSGLHIAPRDASDIEL